MVTSHGGWECRGCGGGEFMGSNLNICRGFQIEQELALRIYVLRMDVEGEGVRI